MLLIFFMNWASDVASVLLSTYNITIIMLCRILYFVYLYPFLGLGLFMLYLCYLFLIFSHDFIVINHALSFKQAYLFFVQFLEYLLLFLYDNMDEENKYFSNSKCWVSGCCLAFAWFLGNFSLALIKKACNTAFKMETLLTDTYTCLDKKSKLFGTNSIAIGTKELF